MNYYLPLAQRSEPDALVGQFGSNPDEATIRAWIDSELERVFPAAQDLVQKMELQVLFKDVTYETLNQPDFLKAVKAEFPRMQWDKVYEEFRAAGETRADSKRQ